MHANKEGGMIYSVGYFPIFFSSWLTDECVKGAPTLHHFHPPKNNQAKKKHWKTAQLFTQTYEQ